MSIGHFQTSAMDTAKVLSEYFLVLDIVRTWVATIKPDRGTVEPHKGIDCLNLTVGRFFVGKMSPAALCQAIIILREGAPFHPFEILMVAAQVQGNVPSLNKIGKMPLVPLGDQELSWQQPGHWD